MNFVQRLLAAQDRHHSLLCVGLDPEPSRFPAAWRDQPRHIFDFCAAIVEATHDVVCTFKPQIAYFAAHRAEDQLERLIAHIRCTAPYVPIILDAKRGDIGSTAEQYAKEAFERYAVDAVTLSPYMGWDTVEPYLRYPDKGVFLLCRTSNPGGQDWQNQRLADLPHQPRLFEHLAAQAQAAEKNGAPGQIGLVVGATYPEDIARVRAQAPTLPLLIPGVGAQGGDALATVRAGLGSSEQWTKGGTIAVNSSRAILYAGTNDAFAAAARRAAINTRDTLNTGRQPPA